jgi:hypothetical protein
MNPGAKKLTGVARRYASSSIWPVIWKCEIPTPCTEGIEESERVEGSGWECVRRGGWEGDREGGRGGAGRKLCTLYYKNDVGRDVRGGGERRKRKKEKEKEKDGEDENGK